MLPLLHELGFIALLLVDFTFILAFEHVAAP